MKLKKRDPKNFDIVARAGDIADPSKLPNPDFESSLISASLIPWWHGCGHKGHLHFTVKVKGAPMKRMWLSRTCPTCTIKEHESEVIHCALCGLPITPGDGVAIYSSDTPEVNPEFATSHKTGGVYGCMRWDCAPCGAFFAGNWRGKEGFVAYKF